MKIFAFCEQQNFIYGKGKGNNFIVWCSLIQIVYIKGTENIYMYVYEKGINTTAVATGSLVYL